MKEIIRIYRHRATEPVSKEDILKLVSNNCVFDESQDNLGIWCIYARKVKDPRADHLLKLQIRTVNSKAILYEIDRVYKKVRKYYRAKVVEERDLINA